MVCLKEHWDFIFKNAKNFNQDISTKKVTVGSKTYTAWDVSNVNYSNDMFDGAINFKFKNAPWYNFNS